MKRLYFLVLMTAVAIFGAFLWNSGNSGTGSLSAFMGHSTSGSQEQNDVSNETDIIYFYGEECPHCHEVLKFLDENKITEKVNYEKKEVWHNKENSKQMMEKVEQCGLSKSQIGVPFLYAEGECFVGTPDVLGFFSEKAGL